MLLKFQHHYCINIVTVNYNAVMDSTQEHAEHQLAVHLQAIALTGLLGLVFEHLTITYLPSVMCSE